MFKRNLTRQSTKTLFNIVIQKQKYRNMGNGYCTFKFKRNVSAPMAQIVKQWSPNRHVACWRRFKSRWEQLFKCVEIYKDASGQRQGDNGALGRRQDNVALSVIGNFAVGNFAVGNFAVGYFAVRKFRRKEVSP